MKAISVIFSLVLLFSLGRAQEEDFGEGFEEVTEEEFGAEDGDEFGEESSEEFEDVTEESGLEGEAESDVVEEAAPQPLPSEEETFTGEETIPPLEDPNTAQGELVATPEPMGSDEPDLGYESDLHNIFVNFHQSKTPEEQWDALVGQRKSEIYVVQSGDNLWRISETLFGDGNYWPKIWSLNGRISNPHLISPGNHIKFLLGDIEDAPAFAVTESAPQEMQESAENEAAAQAGVDLSQTATPSQTPKDTLLDEEYVEIPPPSITSNPVLMKIPPSLPEWQSNAEGGNYDTLGIHYEKRPIAYLRDEIYLSGYILPAVPSSQGEVVEIESGTNLASALQHVYLKLPAGVGREGKSFLCVQNGGPVQSDFFGSAANSPGVGIEVQGTLQVVEKVEPRNDKVPNVEYFRALVIEIIQPVAKGCILVEGAIQKVSVAKEGPRSNVASQIIGGNYDNRRQVFGPQSLVYLNRGLNADLKVGEVLPVRANRLVRRSESKVFGSHMPIGYVKIVRSESTVATGVITEAWEDIHVGDYTGDTLGPQLSKRSEELSNEVDQEFSDDLEDDLKVIEGDPEDF